MMKILVLHPDLGIGGAERLVVDAALAMKSLSHEIHIVTTHHDQNHCFEETRNGTLKVTVVADWMPRSIFNKCYALCAYFRMIIAAIYVVFFSKLEFDLIFCDQISACIPFIRISKKKIVFYCHFPDQLLTDRKTFLKKLYRYPIDWFEEWTTGLADTIVVNSKFTAQVFRQTFTRLSHKDIKVIYPSLHFTTFDRKLEGDLNDLKLKDIATVFLSINRYERKKNIGLAIEALKELYDDMISTNPNLKKTVHLIIVGGFDPLVQENRQYYDELHDKAMKLGIEDKISFLKSPSDDKKQLLLHSCTAVLYTPDNEHFGIVPLEAMYMNRPVIAINSGGPRETVIDNETGFLCKPEPKDFAKAMKKFVDDRSLAREMGIAGHEHVVKSFSYDKFVQQFKNLINELHIQ
ncbi:alpha-1,3/1,6-mannosyltransferase ALG2-like [Oppia nitens]|uniref:alpha-1,3/1,6-mannosyltransferase ALG2-like n=1 Tax=Oppia nitens TaxID=1686743 RepID=UPI0023DB129C|nr:alpha-1,3/1,6-mannosyltransferase ALG2-like [Oppia nitens]